MPTKWHCARLQIILDESGSRKRLYMTTVYDWVTVAIFAGLVVLFLQRSSGPPEDFDALHHYAFPSIGCMATNYLGNEGYHLLAVIMLVAVLAYIWYFLKPLKFR